MLTLNAVVASLAVLAALPATSPADELPTPAEVAAGDLKPGEAVTVAGFGEPGYGEAGPDARASFLGERLYVEAAPDGSVYVTDPLNAQVHVVRTDGSIGTPVQPDELRLDEADDPGGSAGDAPVATAVAPDGTVYVAAANGIHRLDDQGVPTPVVRTTPLDIGDEEPAGDAWLGYPSEITVDAAGNLIVVDDDRERIMKVDPSGVITTVAGGGAVALPDSDGGAATAAALVSPRSVAVDSTGAVYFVQSLSDSEDDRYHPVVRRVAPDGTIGTVTGLNAVGAAGDGGPAAEAQLGDYVRIAVDAEDTLYIADRQNGLIRAVAPDGTISAVASTPGADGAPDAPYDIDPGVNGDLYVSARALVMRMDISGRPVAGDCVTAEAGDSADRWADEEPGTVIMLDHLTVERPTTVAAGVDGTMLVIDGATGVAYAIGADDEATATSVPSSPMIQPEPATAMLPGADDVVYVATRQHLTKRYPDGSEVIVAGGGGGEERDGRPATTTDLHAVELACDADGNLYLADAVRGDVVRVAADGTLTTVTEDLLDHGSGYNRNGIAVAEDGTMYYLKTDTADPGVYAVDADGESRAVAGGESASVYDSDGGPGTAAVLPVSDQHDVALDSDGTVYVSTHDGIRRIGTDGVIDTVREPGEDEAAEIDAAGLAFDAYGNLYFADPEGGRVGVVVRPGEVTEPFPWLPVAGGVVLLAVIGAAVVWRRRLADIALRARRRRRFDRYLNAHEIDARRDRTS